MKRLCIICDKFHDWNKGCNIDTSIRDRSFKNEPTLRPNLRWIERWNLGHLIQGLTNEEN